MFDTRDELLSLFIVIALFLLPALILAYRRNLFNQFSFPSLVKVINQALIVQLIFGLILLFGEMNLGLINKGGRWFHFSDIIAGTTFFLEMIGLFLYLPFLLILNIANWVNQFFNWFYKNRKSH